jgi:hypothetical protein
MRNSSIRKNLLKIGRRKVNYDSRIRVLKPSSLRIMENI